jgi:hypothetical protein
MRKYQWVVFDNESEDANHVTSSQHESGAIAMFGYQRIDNDSVLDSLRHALIANGYPADTGICEFITRQSTARNPHSACWMRSDVAIRVLGMDPLDCISAGSLDWLRQVLQE